VLRWQVKDSFGFREVSKTDGGRDNKSTWFAQAKRKKIDNVAFLLDNQNPLPGAASICASFIAEITSIRQRRLLRSRFSRSAPSWIPLKRKRCHSWPRGFSLEKKEPLCFTKRFDICFQNACASY